MKVGMTRALTTVALSPVPVQPRLCELPYGLRWSDLARLLPGFTTSAGARSWVAHRKQGLNGGVTSSILTFGYQVSGHERTETVFVKQASDPAKQEAARYRFLEQRGVALPRLLRSVTSTSGEVIVLEFLPTIGVRPQDALELLDVIAALNTVTNAPADVFAAPAGMPESDFDGLVATSLTRLADVASTGNRVDVTRWFEAYKATEETVARLPAGLCHGELAFQQVGRTKAGRVVVFDLETVAVRPRLTDIAAILGGLAELTGLTQRDLFGRYRQAVARLDARRSEPERAWTELLAVRVVSSFQSLPWLIETLGNGDVGFDPAAFAHDLSADLLELDS